MEESDIPGLYFMRARYYSADAGVFLSTDPVKKIGPGWKPTAYGYAGANPLTYLDPAGLHYTKAQAEKIMRYQQEALKWELEVIRYERNANILQGVYDFLQTSESFLTGDAIGVVGGLSKQLSTLQQIRGKESSAEALGDFSSFTEVVGAAYNVGKIGNSASKLSMHYESIGGNWSSISSYSATGPVGSMYGEVLKPLVSNGVKGIGQTADAVIIRGTESNGGGTSFGNKSIPAATTVAGAFADLATFINGTKSGGNSGGLGSTSTGGSSGSSRGGNILGVGSPSTAIANSTPAYNPPRSTGNFGGFGGGASRGRGASGSW